MEKFYVTTAIDYVNATPHIGHAYEKIAADIVARYHRIHGKDVFFLTGVDEHGSKVEKSARAADMEPREFCNQMSAKFEQAWKNLNLSYDKFIRTTDDYHEKAVQHLFKRMQDKGDIYKGTYKGLYCEGCEDFVRERDLDEDGNCPNHQKPPKEVEENNYFFRLTNYKDQIKSWLEANPDAVRPEGRKKEILNQLDDPDLGDFLVGWLGIEASSPLHRWHRLIAIVAWLVTARLTLWLVQAVGRLAILSSWGPFRFVFPRQPLRAATLLSLLVNSAKYVLYGVGLGFVLSTFDVDYTTYIASLSVIGLAIGFGSQGLVQDMVTGLFILVESQFDVGDVVEVSGQTGVVQEMGLRMTRLRTIQNQMVTIPNRSIATVARYGPRGLQVELTVSPAQADQAGDVAAVVGQVVADVRQQFPAALMATLEPRIDRRESGRCVVRTDIDLWPGQQTLIDQQLLPRLRAALPADPYGDTASTAAWHFDRPELEPTGGDRLRRWFGRRGRAQGES